MTPEQADRWTDKLLTRISHRYAIPYHDDGELHICTVFPGATLADVSITGWPDDWDLQGIVCDGFVEAVASDLHDGFLASEIDDTLSADAEAVGLSIEELRFATQTEYEPNAPHQLPAELLDRWEREDEQQEAEDDLQQRKREAMQSVRQVLQFGATLCRNGYRQHAAALSAIARDGWEAIEDPEAVEQLAAQAEGALLECGATAPCGNYY